MGLRINESWKVLIGTLGLSLVGCGGAALEGEDTLARSAQQLEGEPTLTLNGASEVTLECGVDSWADPGATATDGAGAALEVATYNSGFDEYGPGPNAGAEGSYYVQYSATDADGRTVQALRTVLVDDTTAPTLTLNGDAAITHPCGSNFVDPGASSSDGCYGGTTAWVVTTGWVNGWVEGEYTLEYSVSDGAGNAAAPVTRTVTVVGCPVY
ncbi:MAG: DUF5011 domain-containing protein [Myxococcaceae bacterium]|nr:DUF5011 domain-containing protein [Myxococcaceae bacterium]